jgi:hypothetical protein
MKLFRCDHCGQTLYFENVTCGNCGRRLGYLPEDNDIISLDADGATWTSPNHPGQRYIFCANEALGSCNWLIAAETGGPIYCRACRHNEMIPDLSDPIRLTQWQTIERAKHRLIYALLRLNLPLATRTEDPVHGLSFRFLAEDLALMPIMTGHQSGTITLSLAEADDAQRELRRTQLREPYRTLLGHFRHEIGHHYWDLLVAGQATQAEYRALFGDETLDYVAALQQYYAGGATPDWQQRYISAYATAHAWEDFAETWAHYMHIIDTLETAVAFGVRTRPEVDETGDLAARFTFDPYAAENIQLVIDHWIPLALLLNNLNRSMGHPDAYPFVLTPQVIEKLGFVHRLVRNARTASETSASTAA